MISIAPYGNSASTQHISVISPAVSECAGAPRPSGPTWGSGCEGRQTTAPPRIAEAVGVDDAPRVAVDAADRGDPPVRDRDIRGVAGQAGAVDDVAAADHEVVAHRRPPPASAKLHITRNVFARSTVLQNPAG